MTKTVEFYFDVGSPASYLAWTRLPEIADRTGAEIVWRPMLLGGVFKATGNRSPAEVPAKSRYIRQDIARYVERYGIRFRHNPDFPINTLYLMRGAEAYRGTPEFHRYLTAIFEAMWAEPRNLNDPDQVAEVLQAAGFDPAEVMRRVESQDVKDRLKAATGEAVERGVFGAPTFFVGDVMWFGQDRLDWVEEALA